MKRIDWFVCCLLLFCVFLFYSLFNCYLFLHRYYFSSVGCLALAVVVIVVVVIIIDMLWVAVFFSTRKLMLNSCNIFQLYRLYAVESKHYDYLYTLDRKQIDINRNNITLVHHKYCEIDETIRWVYFMCPSSLSPCIKT